MALPFQCLLYKQKIVARRSIIIHRFVPVPGARTHQHSKTLKSNLCHEWHFSLFGSFSQPGWQFMCVFGLSRFHQFVMAHIQQSTPANCHPEGRKTGAIDWPNLYTLKTILRTNWCAHCPNKFYRCQWDSDKEAHTPTLSYRFWFRFVLFCFIWNLIKLPLASEKHFRLLSVSRHRISGEFVGNKNTRRPKEINWGGGDTR